MKVTEKYYAIADKYDISDVIPVLEQDEQYIRYPCRMFADQAGKTGLVIFDSEAKLIKSLYVERGADEGVTEFKLGLEEVLSREIDRYKIDKVYHEDVYAGQSFDTVKVLLSIKEAFADIGVKKGVEIFTVNNAHWKNVLSAPSPWSNKINHKEQVKYYVSRWFPYLDEPQDILDALGMGIALHVKKTNSRHLPFRQNLNKRLGVITEVFILSDMGQLLPVVHNSQFAKKIAKGLPFHYYDFDEKFDLETNCRYILSNKECIAVCLIPDNMNLGQLLLKHRIKPSQISKESFLIGVGSKKA